MIQVLVQEKHTHVSCTLDNNQVFECGERNQVKYQRAEVCAGSPDF